MPDAAEDVRSERMIGELADEVATRVSAELTDEVTTRVAVAQAARPTAVAPA